ERERDCTNADFQGAERPPALLQARTRDVPPQIGARGHPRPWNRQDWQECCKHVHGPCPGNLPMEPSRSTPTSLFGLSTAKKVHLTPFLRESGDSSLWPRFPVRVALLAISEKVHS